MFNPSLNFEATNLVIYVIKTFFISICSYYTFLRIINIKNIINKNFLLAFASTLISTLLCSILKYKSDSITSTMILLLLLTISNSLINKKQFGHSLLITILSVSINYILFIIAISISFIINCIKPIQSDFINILIMSLIHIVFVFAFFKIRKFKNGISFLYNNISNQYFNVVILNASVAILFSFVILSNFDLLFTIRISFALLIFAIISFITIQNTITLYYKHKLLVTELNDTKSELEKKNKEIADLEAEILEFSKISHSIAHKQKSLEHKLNKLMLQTEAADELDLRDRLNDISKEYSSNNATTPLPKTEIGIIDDMLSCMSDECKENNIDFELQLSGNIHHIINSLITKEELEILLADHIKDAIIAINYSNNINKSILVKLGLFDGEYKLSVYDSGIEFEIETLLNLGIKPYTTHSDNGGTGMGFMNTFDTLRKHAASLYINEITKPSQDNYTKSITISFNNKNEYKVTSYRSNKIKEKNNNRSDLIIV